MPQRSKIMVSVIIATYKRPQSLRTALNSILACTVDQSFDYEVIVADNNSQDDTEHVVKEMMLKFNGRLKYIFEPRQGKSFALNSAIVQSMGKYIAMTDDDCLVEQDYLFHIVQTMEKYKVDILSGKITPVFDGELPKWIDININIFQGPLVYFNLGNNYIDDSSRNILPTGANMILRRSSYEKFGGFTYEGRAEDTEISYRWKTKGASIGFSPEVLVYHQTPVARLNKNYFRKWQFLSGKNSVQIFSENYQPAKRLFLGSPLWLYKRLLIRIWNYIIGFFISKNNFVNELWIWVNLGEICGFNGMKVSFEKKLR